MADKTMDAETIHLQKIDLSKNSFDRANAFLVNAMKPGYNFHDSTIAPALKLIKAEVFPNDPNRARTVFELKAIPSLCNLTGNLHGGAVALIFDMCTSMTVAPVAREGFWDTGHVSRTLNCTYLRPAPKNSECTVESEVMHLGERMGMVRGVIKRKSDGAVCYVCEHGKAAYNHGERQKERTVKKASRI